ncbi:MAG: response regulator transcription factor [Phycisphaerae bacterium]|nr:response regulator transcription factor [Gemmatimonadaceae bacterium]
MTALRVVVADDEPIARRGLLRLLSNVEGIAVVGEAGDGATALQLIRDKKPNVAFLDVQMPGGTGIEVAQALAANERPAIVFVTAYDKFAIDAFEVHAVDYLLKPFDEQRFALALDRVRQRLATHSSRGVDASSMSALNDRLDALLKSLGAVSSAVPNAQAVAAIDSGTAPSPDPVHVSQQAPVSLPDNTFVVRDGERVILVPLAELDWCEAADNYVRLHTRGRKHLIRDTMRNVEERLAGTRSSNARFARIHRSIIVNLARVREIKPAGGGEYAVVLADGTSLTLSRGYRERVMARLGVSE